MRSLSVLGAPSRRPASAAARLAEYLPEDATPAGLVRTLQTRVAGLLGREAALLLPTGKMAQQIALRVHADHSGRRTFAAHPECHPVTREFDGYSVVHGLRFHPLGERHRLFTVEDVLDAPEPPAAVVWELPQREIGGVLPDLADLDDQLGAARAAGAATHLDGARLWEAAAGYGVALDELATRFDSVYVSLYKTLGVPRGALLAGDRAFVKQAWAWAWRLGGESAGNWPLAAFGLMALDEVLPEMVRYRDHARRLAEAISATGVAEVVPDPPQTSLFRVHLAVPAAVLERVHAGLAQEKGVELFHAVHGSEHPGRSFFEISVAEGAMAVAPAEAAGFVAELVHRCRDTERTGA